MSIGKDQSTDQGNQSEPCENRRKLVKTLVLGTPTILALTGRSVYAEGGSGSVYASTQTTDQ